MSPSQTNSPDDSLRTAIDRSVSLLPAADHRLLAALAIFAGPFSLADAFAVCASESTLREVAGRIARLVEASLLVVERRAHGRAVYRLLIPIREYLQATSPADADRVTPFFVDHYLNKAWVWCPDPLQTGADLNDMDDDIDNIREALDSALSAGRGEEAGLAVRALHGYFYDRYLHPEGIRWIERASSRLRERSSERGFCACSVRPPRTRMTLTVLRGFWPTP